MGIMDKDKMKRIIGITSMHRVGTRLLCQHNFRHNRYLSAPCLRMPPYIPQLANSDVVIKSNVWLIRDALFHANTDTL